MKLNFESKADFQASYFGKLADKLLGSGAIGNNIAFHIEEIIVGLSKAWDKAEEQKKTENF